MVLKFYGYYQSPPTKLVAAILHEKGVPFEYTSVDLMKTEQKHPDFLAKQPFGQIPVIDDDGFILYESRAIARYLDEKYSDQGPKLIPTDLRKRALFEQAASVEAFNFERYALPLVIENFYKKKFLGQDPDVKKVEELKKDLAAKLDVYEQILSRQKYIAGDELTLADFFHLPTGSQFPAAQLSLIQERPNVARWFNEISSQPSWQKANTLSTA